jgi:hypothetical protein
MKSQREQIKKHLLRGWSITPLQALNLFGCMRLASRIGEIEKEGYVIERKMEKKNGKRYARYWMEK